MRPGGDSDLTSHCPTLTIRRMKTFIAAIVLAMFAGSVTAEIKSETVDYRQGETVCERH
jgi:hypothetical protein